jgi:hypothetical protein
MPARLMTVQPAWQKQPCAGCSLLKVNPVKLDRLLLTTATKLVEFEGQIMTAEQRRKIRAQRASVGNKSGGFNLPNRVEFHLNIMNVDLLLRHVGAEGCVHLLLHGYLTISHP